MAKVRTWKRKMLTKSRPKYQAVMTMGERASGSDVRWYNMNKMNKLAYVMRLLGRYIGWAVVAAVAAAAAAAPRWRFGTSLAESWWAVDGGAPHLEICLNAALIICHEIFIARYH